nr:unnamed protein product [Salmo salar]|eukprot:XP_014030063.1 PREDICTED: vesicle-associated membrane protein 7-like [Salmo salar]
MAILFAVVARSCTILAKHAWCGGNFLEVTEQILAKIPSENNKLTYSHGSYLFHYICHDRIIYLCITDDDFERSRAFSFLGEVKKRFQTTYGSRAQTALPYAMKSEFPSTLMAQMQPSLALIGDTDRSGCCEAVSTAPTPGGSHNPERPF